MTINVYNMFSQIKNAQIMKKNVVFIKKQKQCLKFLNLLWVHGFIIGYKLMKKKIKIFLKYSNNQPVINQLQFISKPSRKVYFSVSKLWKINSNNLFLIVSTNQGLLPISVCKKNNIGGELVLILN